MKWIKIESGNYRSIDNRFNILKVWDRLYGVHWELIDIKTNLSYHGDSLKHCKQIAEKYEKNYNLKTNKEG